MQQYTQNHLLNSYTQAAQQYNNLMQSFPGAANAAAAMNMYHHAASAHHAAQHAAHAHAHAAAAADQQRSHAGTPHPQVIKYH